MLANRVRMGSGVDNKINLTNPELWENGTFNSNGYPLPSVTQLRLRSSIKLDTNKILIQCNGLYKIDVYFNSSATPDYTNFLSSQLDVQNKIINSPINTFLTILVGFINNEYIYVEDSTNANVILNLL